MKLASETTAGLWVPLVPSLDTLLARLDFLSLERASAQRQASRSRNTSCPRAAHSLLPRPSATAVRTHSAASAFMLSILKEVPR